MKKIEMALFNLSYFLIRQAQKIEIKREEKDKYDKIGIGIRCVWIKRYLCENIKELRGEVK